jgi:soluble lytic murein transglycosylase
MAIRPRSAAAIPARVRKRAFLWVLCLAVSLRAQDLSQLARAWVEQRTAPAETALRQFAEAHAAEQAGAVAYLVLGYTKFQDKQFAAAVEYLRQAVRVRTRVADYAEFYLAAALQNNANHPDAIPVLTGFETRHPDSYLIARATIALGTGLAATGQPRRAAELIATRLSALPRPAADAMLANAWEAAGDQAKAAKAFAEIFYRYPASSEALEAETRVAAFAKPTREMLQARAQGLFDGGLRAPSSAERTRLLQAARVAYTILAEVTAGAVKDRAEVKAGRVFYHLGQSSQAKAALTPLRPRDPEAAAERLYYLGEANRRLKLPAAFLAQVKALGAHYPKSPWHEEALFSAGNYTLLSAGPAKAAVYYGKVASLFPQGKYAAQSHWKMAWNAYREGSKPDALRLMQDQAAKFPNSSQAPAALYWAAQLAGNPSPAAAGSLRKLVDDYPLSFYAVIVRQRNPALTPAPRPPRIVTPTAEAGARREKVALLRSVALLDLAANEARQASMNDEANQAFWSLELAAIETARGRHAAAIGAARQFVPDYFRYDIDHLPRRYWEALYPLPWWEVIKEEAAKEGADPHLMAGIIRQESAFNPTAVSRANARGLMQILPSTGRTMARRMGLQGYNTAWLFTPQVSIRMGIVYFKQLLADHGGKLEDTLAAYNAGPHRVVAWRATTYRDDLEFIESIPFTETREYIQIVLRNAEVYRKLYK